MTNNSFVPFPWNGACHGVGTIIKLNQTYIDTHTGNDDKTLFCRAVYKQSFYHNGEQRYFFAKIFKSTLPTVSNEYNSYYEKQLDLQCFNECSMGFSVNDKELQAMIEKIYYDVPVELEAAAQPAPGRKDMQTDYKGKQNFFTWNGKWYGKGTEFFVKDNFMHKYYEQTGCILTKKVKFIWSEIPKSSENRMYKIYSCNDMEIDNHGEYKPIYYLTQEEFEEAIEFISTPCAIKGKDWEDPGLLIVFLLCILICIISAIIFANPSAIFMVVIFLFFKLRRKTLFK